LTQGFRPAGYHGPLVCVIGGGPSGVSIVKRLKQHGIAYDCFEASDNIGGNWYYQNPNRMSACYQSLHIDTSKFRFAFEDFPVPDVWPDYPHHSEIFQYLNDYVDHFQLRDTFTFNTKVTRAHREADGRWTVETSTGRTAKYDILIVANGHHWDPRWPEPAYPGEFSGEQIHAHSYNTPFDPIDMRGKRIMVVGAGNSAMDISSELAQRTIAKSLVVSMRHGVWVFPKYFNGHPADKVLTPTWMPEKLAHYFTERTFAKTLGSMESYGLPKPDHKPWEAHGSLSSEFLLRAGSGDLKAKPGIVRFEGDVVHFTDGSTAEIDVIVWATGYKISFPFFDQPEFTADKDNKPPPLYKRMLTPGVNNLIYIGLAQPLPTLVNFAEQQSKFVAAYIDGSYALPDEKTIRETIAADDEYYLSKYYRSPRHTIQLDFYHYSEKLAKEIEAGKKRKERGAKPASFTSSLAPEEAARQAA
jgi:cation diffusion facilitator CzcD-associated flavoprotein CzcO